VIWLPAVLQQHPAHGHAISTQKHRAGHQGLVAASYSLVAATWWLQVIPNAHTHNGLISMHVQAWSMSFDKHALQAVVMRQLASACWSPAIIWSPPYHSVPLCWSLCATACMALAVVLQTMS